MTHEKPFPGEPEEMPELQEITQEDSLKTEYQEVIGENALEKLTQEIDSAEVERLRRENRLH